MKKILVCCLLLVVGSFVLAQSATGGKEEKIQQLKIREEIKVTEVEKDLYKIENKLTGDAFLEDLSGGIKYKASDNIDSLVIEIFSIDTILYSNMYKFWMNMNISNTFYGLLINDLNSNGLIELYGNRTLYNSISLSPGVFELEQTGEYFNQIYIYPDTILTPKAVYDIDNDSLKEMLMRRKDGGLGGAIFFKQPDLNSLPVSPYFEYPKASNKQINFPTFGDFDKDGKVEFAYTALGKTMYMAEFNPVMINFDSVFSFVSNMDVGKMTTGDFDCDDETDIVISNMYGNVHLIEAQGDNQYINIWNGSVPIRNAYYTFATNDIDKNGKPEFWVGGKHLSNGILLTCFESNGNNTYQPVFKIKIPDYYTIYPLTTFADDLDGDGEEEIVICADYFMLVLKFTGSPDNHDYSIWFFRMNQAGDGETWTVVVHDINGDNKKELFFDTYIQRDSLGQSYWIDINRIFKPNYTVGIEEQSEKITNDFNLLVNYPNPFNPLTNIKFTLKKSENVSMNVYNILGKEIKILLNENLPTGEHIIQWDGKDDKANSLAGGVYFIQINTGEYRQIIKAVLLK